MKKTLESVLVNGNDSIKKVMSVIDTAGLGIALIVDEKRKLEGIVTDGDIRRKILNGVDINEPVNKIMNKNPITAKKGASDSNILGTIRSNENAERGVPIVDHKGVVVDIAILSELEKKNRMIYVVKDDLKKTNTLRKILVIGGAGYLGTCLVRKLLGKGYNVRVFDNLTFGKESLKEFINNPNFELQEGDIRNISHVVKAIIGVDAVIHLAAIVGDPACGLDPISTVENNYLATKTIAEVCKHHQINRFIFASSCSVYGASEKGILNENSPLSPVSLYARSKIDSEKGVLSLVDENFAPTIFRMATLYGRSNRMRFDLVVNTFIGKAIEEKGFTVFGGEQWRPFLHVDDAADSYILCLETPINDVRGQIFNVGSNEQNYKIIELGEMISDFTGANMDISKKIMDLRNYRVNFDKISKKLSFKAKKTIKDAVIEIKDMFKKKTVKTYRDKKYSNKDFLSNLNNSSL